MSQQQDAEPIDVIDSITLWFEQAMPEPSQKNMTTQLGVHFEEFAEMLDTLVPTLEDQDEISRFKFLVTLVHHTATFIKGGGYHFNFDKLDRTALLDSLCDQIVTATGVGHTQSMDVFGALCEVDDSNWSKFDDKGHPLFDENQKIIKGPNYRRAELKPFSTRYIRT